MNRYIMIDVYGQPTIRTDRVYTRNDIKMTAGEYKKLASMDRLEKELFLRGLKSLQNKL